MGFQKARKAYYDAPEGQVHYRYLPAVTKDESKALILLLHQSACSSVYYKEMISILSSKGHDVYAPDMPGFGASYKPTYQPPGIKYYVDVYMTLIKQLGIPKFHVLGHHSGASIATELAVLHPNQVLSLSVVGLAAMTPAEQKKFADAEIVMFNKPVKDGSHFLKVWDYLDVIGLDVVDKHYQTLDNARAYEGRIQVYTCVFSQPVIELTKKVSVPFLVMCSEEDVLFPYMETIKEVKPDATFLIVGGNNFEVMRDAPGVTKAMLDLYAKL